MKKFIPLLLTTLVISLLLIHCKDDDDPPITLKYTLTTEAKPAEGGSITPASGSYEKSSTVSIKATPANGYTFIKWSGGFTGDSNPASLTMNTDKKVIAEFEINVPTYTNGEGIIGPNGGTVTIEDSNSPLNGVSIVIPEGALSSDQNIKISLAPNTVLFPYENVGKLIKFEPEGLQFSKEIEIGIPYPNYMTDTSNLAVVNFVPEPEEIIESRKIKVDTENLIIKSNTDHFSYYLAWDKRIRLQVEMLSVNDKIGAQLNIVGLAHFIANYKMNNNYNDTI